MSVTSGIIGVLTFNKQEMEKIANDESATMWAFLIALAGSLIAFAGGILEYLAIDPSDTILREAAMTVAITGLLTTVLMLFVFAGIMGFVLRGFGGTATLIQCLRVFGFTQVWSLIGTLLDFVLGFADVSIGFELSFILGLVGLAAFILGLTTFSGLGLGSAIFAVIIAYILAIILVFVLIFLLLIVLLAVFLSVLV